ncbi:MAG TPA: MOSC domain-containing protein [Candidatus Limnocylindrales bacterium]|nr:MOSC domain-containing protein [Candidatus Limnocylindrales bacterium]
MGRILAINLAVPEPSDAKGLGTTGINKQPVRGPVLLRAPGARTTGLGSGAVGDRIFDVRHHGGNDQAVYAYAWEDYDWWEGKLGRALPGGLFGENLTTEGVDVNGALVGERWRIGQDVVLQAALPRIPCNTFAVKMAEPQWIKTFTEQARPGSYLRVVEPGYVRAGDEITVVHRPRHDLSIAELFRALTTEPDLLPKIVGIQEVPAWLRVKTLRRLGG